MDRLNPLDAAFIDAEDEDRHTSMANDGSGDRSKISRDIIGDSASCVFDSGLTQASGSLAKVFGWYDNEWGYTCRLADLTAIVGERL